MNTKKCPQCKNLISITAPTCLHCGRPNKFVTKDYINKKWRKSQNNKINFYKFFKYRYLIFSFIIFTLIIIFYNI